MRSVRSSADLRIQETMEVTARDSVVVELRDTLVETTTITIDRNEVGDTLKVVQVTDRTRARNRDGIAKQETKVVVRVDTVYVATRDSVSVVRDPGAAKSQSGGTALRGTLKWVFAVVVALTILTITITITKRMRR